MFAVTSPSSSSSSKVGFVVVKKKQSSSSSSSLRTRTMRNVTTQSNANIQRLGPEDPRLSQIVIHNNTVYLSGQVGSGGADIKAQTKETCDKIDQLLSLAGTDKTNLLQCMIWVKDIKNDYAGMNEVYNEWIKDGKPVRACVESNMVYKQEGVQLLVEIQATAALPQ